MLSLRRSDSLDIMPSQTMNAFLYLLSGKAAIGGEPSEENQIGPHNTITLTKVQ